MFVDVVIVGEPMHRRSRQALGRDLHIRKRYLQRIARIDVQRRGFQAVWRDVAKQRSPPLVCCCLVVQGEVQHAVLTVHRSGGGAISLPCVGRGQGSAAEAPVARHGKNASTKAMVTVSRPKVLRMRRAPLVWGTIVWFGAATL